MKKIITLTFMAALLSVNSLYSQVLYGFTSGTEGWTTGNDPVTIDCGATSIPSTWALSTQTGGSSPTPFGSTWFGTPNIGDMGPERSWIESPSHTASSTAVGITFDSYSSNEGGWPFNFDVEHVQISVNGGSFTDLHAEDPNLHTSSDKTFRNISYSTTVGIGDQVVFRFLYDTCDGCCGPTDISGWYVDNILISGVDAPAPIPTMSEWGLFILALLTLTLGAVTVRRRQMALAGAGNASVSLNSLPFERNHFAKMLAIVLAGFTAIFAVAVLGFGYEMTSADVPGSLLAAPVAAYLLHMLVGKNEE